MGVSLGLAATVITTAGVTIDWDTPGHYTDCSAVVNMDH